MDPRLWNLSARESFPGTRRGNSPLRKLEESNQKSTTKVLQSRWGVLTPVRGVYAPGRIV